MKVISTILLIPDPSKGRGSVIEKIIFTLSNQRILRSPTLRRLPGRRATRNEVRQRDDVIAYHRVRI